MTAATPGRELLAWADECQAAMDAGGFSAVEKRKATAVVAALRLAAKPVDEGVRIDPHLLSYVLAFVEDAHLAAVNQPPFGRMTRNDVAQKLRSLSTTGEPKR